MSIFGLPTTGLRNHVRLHDIGLPLAEGSYKVAPVERFGTKMAIGALKYNDFTPNITPFALSDFSGGYGARSYTDLAESRYMPSETFPQTVPPFYLEASDVDCRETGIVRLGPKKNVEILVGSTSPVIWMGEITVGAEAYLLAVSGTQIFKRNALAGWSDTGIVLPAEARRGAVGVFNGRLIIGYGSAHTAQYTDDLVTLSDVVNSSSVPIYIYALSADHAAVYAAGGSLATNNTVVSSATGIDDYDETVPTVCGTSDSEITGLAPGGSVAFLFVGKETELGQIDFDGNYSKLLPFDSRLESNCRPIQWSNSVGGDAQQGPMVVLFGRDKGLWDYQPSSSDSGGAHNLTPWAAQGIRPPNARGAVTAIQGTARYLYYSIQGSTGSWILARDSRTGANHSLISLGDRACAAMTVTGLFSTEGVYIFYGYGNDVAYSKLDFDGLPQEYALVGTLTLPTIDYMFPGENKVLYTLKIVADDLVGGEQTIDVSVALDGGNPFNLGTASVSPESALDFPSNTVVKKLDIVLTFHTNDPAKTPKLRGIELRGRVNTKLYRTWTFQASIPQAVTSLNTEDGTAPLEVLDTLWNDADEGVTVPFTDRWGREWAVCVLSVVEAEIVREPDRVPETGIAVTLMEQRRGPGSSTYDDPLSVYDAPTTIYG